MRRKNKTRLARGRATRRRAAGEISAAEALETVQSAAETLDELYSRAYNLMHELYALSTHTKVSLPYEYDKIDSVLSDAVESLEEALGLAEEAAEQMSTSVRRKRPY